MPNEEFDQAADAAFQEWKAMEATFTPEQRAFLAKLVAWWKKWYMSAGHRRLGAIFLGRRG